MRFAVVAHSSSPTNLALAAGGWNGVPGELLTPREALLTLGRGDVALARLDVRQSLDGVEDGLWALERLAEAGIRVLNRPDAVVLAHDKLLTARVLRRAGLPHPRTTLIERNAPLPDLDFPAVVKPRFGSWGEDVKLCRDREELRAVLEGLTCRLWFRATGAVAQELIPPLGHDLRLVVAGGRIVAAAKRIARSRRVAHQRRARRERRRRPSRRRWRRSSRWRRRRSPGSTSSGSTCCRPGPAVSA